MSNYVEMSHESVWEGVQLALVREMISNTDPEIWFYNPLVHHLGSTWPGSRCNGYFCNRVDSWCFNGISVRFPNILKTQTKCSKVIYKGEITQVIERFMLTGHLLIHDMLRFHFYICVERMVAWWSLWQLLHALIRISIPTVIKRRHR